MADVIPNLSEINPETNGPGSAAQHVLENKPDAVGHGPDNRDG